MAATEPGGPGPRRPGKPAIRRFLVDAVASRCKVPATEVDPDRPLDELGLTSRDAVAIAGELEKLVGARLPATLLYEHRTIARLTDVIAEGEFSAPYGDSVNDAPPLSAVSDEPIAVIGIGCRFPGGVSGPETYWRFLLDGGDGIRAVPDGRWDPFDDGTLEDVTRFGGFLDDVAGFDSRFFGITPDEADVMDPQQRLLLEVAWEAFQHAGVAPPSLRGSRTGVFVGVSAPEYGYVTGTAPLRPYTATGAALSIVANRLSYLLDLRGPSMIVDTACSSSLVATHLAVRSLRAGESDLAVAGGVNVLLSPLITKTFDLGGATAPDGRCKPFDASADGMVRAEGCGALVLKRLSDARRDGDRVLAVVRGSAVNSDGRSTGLVAPNAEAQVAVLRAAYAGLGRPDYVEAHGTGTLLGDPIEARALGAALGGPDPDGPPVLIGSVKSNLGHLEAAAGVAGLIKVVLALAHRRIPASLHYREPNPHIDFDALGLAVAAEETPWPETRDRPALAGVSGFGFGGTNAHVVLEAAPAEDERPRRRREPPVHTLLLSDVDAGRIGPYAAGLADWLEAGDAALPDVARTLNRRFGRGRAAAAVVGRDRTALAAALRAPRITGVTVARDAPPVWVFSGYGAQRPGMGRRLLADEPAFAAAIDALDGPFAAQAGFSLWDTLESGERVTGVYRTMTTLFGLQIGLAALLRSYGAEPGAVIGHSMGEAAAAVVAGALSMEDGVTVMTCRARLLDGIAEEGGGAMLVMGCAADDALAYARSGADVHVAVRSSPRQTVLTGDAGELARVAARATDDGLLARVVQAEGAGHSPAVDPILDPLRVRLADVRGRLAEVPFYSTVLEDPREAPAFDGDYWAANARRTVRLADAVAAAAEDGFTAFVEVNAHPLLAQAITETADGALVVPTLRRPPHRPDQERRPEADDTVTFHEALATLTVHGHLPARTPDGHVIDVPAPAWEHRRHWIDATPRGATGLHPLLGAHVELPGEDRHVWSADVGAAASPWADRPFGHPLLPAAAYAEIALAAGTELLGPDAAVSGLHLHRPVPLDEHTTLTTSVTLADDGATVEIHTRTPAATWTPIASATVSARPARPADETGDPIDDLGVAAEVEIGPAAEGNRHFRLHPDVFGRCLAAAADLLGEGAWLPESIGGLRVYGPTRHGGRCLIRLTPADDGRLVGLRLVGEGGRTLAEATDIRMRSYGRTDLPVPLSAKLAELTWESADATPADPSTAGTPAAVASEAEESAAGAADGDPFADAVVLAAPGDPVAGALPDGVVREIDDWVGAERSARDLVTAAEVPAHVVTLPPADLTDERLVLAVSGLVRGLTSGSVPPRLWLVTRGALRPTGTGKGDPGQAFAGAMVRVLGFETPGLRATHLDLDPEGPPDAAVEAIAAELRARPADTEIARRGGKRYVARLAVARLDGGRLDGGHGGDGRVGGPVHGGRSEGRLGGSRLGDDGRVGGSGQGRSDGGRPGGGRRRAVVRRGAAYVISGGYGGLGLVTARLLAERGAGRIVLSGRNGPPPEAEKAISELRESGVEVEVVLGDVAAPGVAERMVAAAGDRLRGVVHAAGGLADRIFTDIDAADLRRVWEPKVDGAYRLYAATRGRDLDWWVVYSSAAALLGSPGQGAYAAANAAVDALTGSLRERGVPAYTINWGTWSRVGGAANLSGGPASGIDPITPEEGAEAFEALLAHGRPATGVLRFDPRQAVAAFPELGRMPYFSALVEALPEAEDDWPGAEALRAAEPSAARALVRGRVAERVATVLGFAPDPAQSLTDLGLDSLVAVRIKSALEHDLGLTVPATVLLQGGSVNVLTTWALTELGLADPESPAAPAAGTRPGFVDARDAAERLVVRVFERVLGADRVSATDDFFALGGREDQARTVLEILELEVGRPIDHAELFAHPTVEHLASVIRAGEEEAARRIVRPLTSAARGRPFFCVHPAGGTTGVYRQLATLVGGPFFGLERFADAPSVEERAARYADLIREAQPEGPYRLGGWSFGGVVAYETARILGDVELLALIDAGIPRRADDPGEAAARRYADFAAYLNETYDLGVVLDVEELRPLGEDAQLALVMERAAPLMEKLPPAILHHQLTSHEDTRSLEAYRPEPYDGRVVLYRATEPTPWTVRDARYELDETNGFGDLCPRLDVVPIRGAHHLNLLDPPAVHALAGHLGALLIQ
ncbi:type I polyketide synthase [Actinoallomurus rhizosphaericola]|uniref:type I polyketide synthase n=1 Tax=Actinoallomurus rhizosphaericola TaxID=2952536 RepID=UPI002092860E|nr:type I polyketide synthase [Actinoallomurus rhizosphaericola]MCO5994844.1 SDR family NAD(P)-dependent oxidoreductase [Actinoallomurus rhizosphaericola]